MGSTQNVGSSVISGREPAANDSSPMLVSVASVPAALTMRAPGMEYSQLEVRVLLAQPALDELLDRDVVLGDEVD